MPRLTLLQWLVLASPIVIMVSFLGIAAGWQIHQWGINWVWGIFILLLVSWRWLLVRWTKPIAQQVDEVIAAAQKTAQENLEASVSQLQRGGAVTPDADRADQIETALQEVLIGAQGDRPLWEDWNTFWQRCQQLIVAVAQIYYPDVKYPLLNIYVPQAYTLLRGTVDDLAQWMDTLSPVLNQVTIGQAYQAYETYQKLEPAARKFMRVWNWAQWVLNPVAALARQSTLKTSNQATQELLLNFNQLLREAALRNLCHQAVMLYGGHSFPVTEMKPTTPATLKAQPRTQTLREILATAEPVEQVEQEPVNILLVGRTGAGKSSLINTLFQTETATVDVLPSTDQIQNYTWQAATGERLNLWDTPGYEQVQRSDLRDLVLDYATRADLLLLVTPALDPALQMDVDFLADLKADCGQTEFTQGAIQALPTIAIVTQVDRLRPVREWQPPYDWQWGDRPKEQSIRDAVQYRAEQLADYCDRILPIVNSDAGERTEWGIEILSVELIAAIAPSKQLRLARFLQNQEARIHAAARIIDRYTWQMSTTQGLTNLLKRPVLNFLSTLATGSPALAYLLAEQIPVEQLPVVIGKLQMAYDLFSLLEGDRPTLSKDSRNFDLLDLWPALLDNPTSPDQTARAFGYALVEYWTKDLTGEQLRDRVQAYIQ
jgi:predicted GTPase